MGLEEKHLSTWLMKNSHFNYVLEKVIGWNFLKKDSSVSYSGLAGWGCLDILL